MCRMFICIEDYIYICIFCPSMCRIAIEDTRWVWPGYTINKQTLISFSTRWNRLRSQKFCLLLFHFFFLSVIVFFVFLVHFSVRRLHARIYVMAIGKAAIWRNSTPSLWSRTRKAMPSTVKILKELMPYTIHKCIEYRYKLIIFWRRTFAYANIRGTKKAMVCVCVFFKPTTQ